MILWDGNKKELIEKVHGINRITVGIIIDIENTVLTMLHYCARQVGLENKKKMFHMIS